MQTVQGRMNFNKSGVCKLKIPHVVNALKGF